MPASVHRCGKPGRTRTQPLARSECGMQRAAEVMTGGSNTMRVLIGHARRQQRLPVDSRRQTMTGTLTCER